MDSKNRILKSVKKTGMVLNKICMVNRGLLFIIPVGMIIFIISMLRENGSFIENMIGNYYVNKFSYHSLSAFHQFIYIKSGIKGLCCMYAVELSYAIIVSYFLFDRLYRLLSLLQESESPFSNDLIKHIRALVILFVIGNISRPLYAVFGFLAGHCLLKVFEYGVCLQYESDETV